MLSLGEIPYFFCYVLEEEWSALFNFNKDDS